ncbi:2-phosphosulfolactate phosphatase family protein [Clostridium sp. YIM B02515]|uniref:Probable 2-phosphosulfolactate phosphatase n=1 Tax=Clostridium rhizosphaerae TaxID=2803861 RepID=A0ABS1TBH3_9CLOT|nr:2-phosphosulfolactate phosphatase family protein [Clostridium rhizosphaerae]MBL4936447.1 2-phosphosulfolactate phosphatase family protein [Clostridium rhizosphaerae]
MKIDIIISADDIKPQKVQDKTVLVIDMLRATSVITTAAANGCKEVIPLLTIEEAMELVRENREQYILGGERKALKIEGFDCSNSPLEYSSEVVRDKTIVLTTTNGTRAIKGSEGASDILIGAMINAEAAARRINQLNKDVVIVNAGTYNEFSIDDFICSGYIIDCLINMTHVELMDISKTAHYIYKNNEDIFSFIKLASHYKRIKELGLDEDLKYCCQKSIIDIVPEYKNGKIELYN